MYNFLWCSIFHLCVSALADDDDNVQLIQTRILQKGSTFTTAVDTKAYDLTSYAGQKLCISDHVLTPFSHECARLAVPLRCNHVNYSLAICTCCAGFSCDFECGFVATTTTTTLRTATTIKPYDLTSYAGQILCMNDFSLVPVYHECARMAVPLRCNNVNWSTAICTCCAGFSCDVPCGHGVKTTTPTPTTTAEVPTTTTTAVAVKPTTTAEVPDVSVCPGTNSPGGDTDVTDADCLDAERGFGPDFSCANTEMYCSSDSGDGLTVGACCPTKCKQEFEKKKKNSNAEKKGKNESERKAKRASNEGTRKKNEKDRKTKRKDTEWNTKRDAKEIENKNAEEERKNKRGWKEGQRKSERGWKSSRRERRTAANKREAARKGKNGGSESSKKNQQGEKKQKKKAARKAKKEKRIKKNGRKGKKGPQVRR